MASRVDLILGARDQATAKVDRFERRFGRFARNMVSMQGLIAGAASGVALTRLVRGSFEALAVQEQAEARLRSALEDAGDVDASTMAMVERFASALQRQSTIGDEATISLAAYLSTLSGLAGGPLIEATRQTTGLAKATNQGAEQIGRAYLLALQGNFTMLNRYIPALRSLQTNEERLAEVHRLSAKGLGLLQDEADTASGRYTQFKNTAGDLAEELGERLAPAIDAVTTSGQAAVGAIRLWSGTLDENATAAEISRGRNAQLTAVTAGLGLGYLLVGRRAIVMASGINVSAAALRAQRLAALGAHGRIGAVTRSLGRMRIAQLAARASTFALNTALQGGLLVGLGLVTQAFIRARQENIRYSDSLNRTLTETGLDRAVFLPAHLLPGGEDAIQRNRNNVALEKAQEQLKQNRKELGDARRDVALIDDPEQRANAAGRIVSLLQREIELLRELDRVREQRDRRLAKERADAARDSFDPDDPENIWRSASAAAGSVMTVFEINRQRSEEITERSVQRIRDQIAQLNAEMRSGFAATVLLAGSEAEQGRRLLGREGLFAGLLARSRAQLRQLVSETARHIERARADLAQAQAKAVGFAGGPIEAEAARIRAESERLREALTAGLAAATPGERSAITEQIEAVQAAAEQRLAEMMRDAERRRLDFISSPLEREVRMIEDRKASLLDELDELRRIGRLAEDEAERRARAVREAAGREIAETRQRERELRESAGGGGIASALRPQLPAAVELSARFSGLAGAQRSQAVVAARAAQQRERMAALIQQGVQLLRERLAVAGAAIRVAGPGPGGGPIVTVPGLGGGGPAGGGAGVEVAAMGNKVSGLESEVKSMGSKLDRVVAALEALASGKNGIKLVPVRLGGA
ncbi:MAG: hypothetical protein AAGI68_12170 [Planctomycetota bacterium]